MNSEEQREVGSVLEPIIAKIQGLAQAASQEAQTSVARARRAVTAAAAKVRGLGHAVMLEVRDVVAEARANAANRNQAPMAEPGLDREQDVGRAVASADAPAPSGARKPVSRKRRAGHTVARAGARKGTRKPKR
jgi:hypothetical protein